MPKPVERCVRDLLASSSFKKGMPKKERESSAWAICTAAHNKAAKKQSEDGDTEINENLVDEYLFEMLSDLPDDLLISLDEDGKIQLTDINIDNQEEIFEETKEDLEYDLYFNEEGKNDKFKNYSILKEVILSELACKTDKDKKKEKEAEEIEGQSSAWSPAITKLELLREGLYKHPWYGDIKFDRKYFTKAIQNFANDILQREISFDAQHQPMFGAVAWLKKLGLRRRSFNDGQKRWVLTGVAEFTKDGEEMIKSNRFKYFSIEVDDNFKDKETEEEYGPTVMGGGVTNRPFIPGMLAIELSENAPVDGVAKPGETEGRTFEETTIDDLDQILSELDTIIKDEKIELQNEKKARPPDSQLPDAAFALVKKDSSGKIVKRALPHHGPTVKSAADNGSVDVPRLRNALARWNQVTGFSSSELATGKNHLMSHAKVLLKTHQKDKKAASEPKSDSAQPTGAETMQFEEMIKELQGKLAALDDQNSEIGKTYSEQISKLQAAQAAMETAQNQKLSEQETKLLKLQEQNDQLSKRFAAVDEERRQAKIQLFCERMEKANHFPAVIEVAKKYLLADMNSINVKVFDEKKEEHEVDLMKMFEDMLEAIPNDKRVVLKETLKGEIKDKPDNEPPKGVKTTDGQVVNVFDEARIKKASAKVGFKTNLQ